MPELKPAAYLIRNATARELRFDPLAPSDKWHSYSTPAVEKPLYEIPADQVLVPRELLDQLDIAIGQKDYATSESILNELRTLLHP